ncbi:MAG: NAD-binding protein [Bradymonadaceae bacterium]
MLGLGQFGASVARSLARQHQSVLVVDHRMDRLRPVQDEIDAAVQADTTDESVLYDLELDTIPVVVVAVVAHSTERRS